jgi:NADH dehydrogenase
MNRKKIVVIGGGFAGINFISRIANKDAFEVTLVDKNNYNYFPPLLYQVATGFLDVSNISFPFRKFLQDKANIRFRLGELQQIVQEENKIILSTGVLNYDYLVIATGTESNYFGNENVRLHAFPMKTVDDAINMRNCLLQIIEKATLIENEAERKKFSTIVIAGGGPTGVEVAGMLAEMQKDILSKDYPELGGRTGTIYLVDGSSQLLTPMSKNSQQYTYESLVKMGVKVKLNTQVRDYIDNTVKLSDGEIIETKALIWAAGVTGKTISGISEESYGRSKRLLVDEYNKVKGSTNIFAIGDNCLQLTDPAFLNGHPQLAQVAIQQGKNLASNLIALEKNKSPKPFIYNDKGSMAIIGRNKAVADLPKPVLHFKGFIAWCMWLFIHLVSLIHFRNKIKTVYNWTVAYFSRDQSLRMIIRPRRDNIQ